MFAAAGASAVSALVALLPRVTRGAGQGDPPAATYALLGVGYACLAAYWAARRRLVRYAEEIASAALPEDLPVLLDLVHGPFVSPRCVARGEVVRLAALAESADLSRLSTTQWQVLLRLVHGDPVNGPAAAKRLAATGLPDGALRCLRRIALGLDVGQRGAPTRAAAAATLAACSRARLEEQQSRTLLRSPGSAAAQGGPVLLRPASGSHMAGAGAAGGDEPPGTAGAEDT